MYTIYITDDDLAVRDSLVTLLSLEGHRCVPFADGPALFAGLATQRPDLLILDLKMPGMNGHEVLASLPRPLTFPTLMISAHGDIRAAVDAVRLGAHDFLEKPVDPQALTQMVTTTIEQFHNGPAQNAPSQSRKADFSALTPREKQVATALCDGQTNKEVARHLDLSPRTVEAHRARIFEKLGVKNLASLIRHYYG